MPCIEAFINSLKACWVTKLMKRKVNPDILNFYLEKMGYSLDLMLKSNITDRKEWNSTINIPNFYLEIFECFNSC